VTFLELCGQVTETKLPGKGSNGVDSGHVLIYPLDAVLVPMRPVVPSHPFIRRFPPDRDFILAELRSGCRCGILTSFVCPQMLVSRVGWHNLVGRWDQ